MEGGFGVVVNAPMSPNTIKKIKNSIELPVITTVISKYQNYVDQINAGTDILNIAAANSTIELIKSIRKQYQSIPIIATGSPTDDTIYETIKAGANAITFTPSSNGELFSQKMKNYRLSLNKK